MNVLIVLLHAAIGIAILVIYLARRPVNGRKAWLASLANEGKRLARLEDDRDAEVIYARALIKQLDDTEKDLGALRFEVRVISMDRQVLLEKNLILQKQVDDNNVKLALVQTEKDSSFWGDK